MRNSQKKQPNFTIQIKDLPESFTEAASQMVKNHTVALGINGTFIGSGTFIQWGRNHGILTAEHVVNNPKNKTLVLDASINSNQKLSLSIEDVPHDFGFPANCLEVMTTGRRKSDAYGPDLAVIKLPNSVIGTLRAKKSFWNLTNKTNKKMTAASLKEGCMIVAGHIAESLENLGPRSGFSEVTFIPCLVGFTGGLGGFSKNGFDYLEVGSVCDGTNGAPMSYEGVSGGSFWRVPIFRKTPDSPVEFNGMTLAGVTFYEIIESRGKIRVRAHGPKSIYQKLLGKLRTHQSKSASGKRRSIR